MLLLREQFDEVEYITETTESGKKKLYIHGPFLEADTKNKNGRVYPISTLQNEVTRYVNESVKQNRGVGTLGHENGPTITPDRISHRLVSLEQQNNLFVGKALILETPCGLIVKNLIEGGVKLGVSSRALGSLVEQNGAKVVQNDLKILCVDCVLDPSAPSAWVQGIMEQKEYIYNAATGSYIEQQVEQLYEDIPKYSTQQIENSALKLFEWYLSGITLKNKQN
jgi:hypothetical protein